jgi:hypothetical protein
MAPSLTANHGNTFSSIPEPTASRSSALIFGVILHMILSSLAGDTDRPCSVTALISIVLK